ncbi:MAG: polysaccharide biosynthesis protein [Spirosomaceae bacterium]|nr:polysaccharide biosynthesis protein [Spirosomataceae bacterium]
MGLIVRQGLKSSVGFYIGVGLGAINTLFISTRFLSPDQLAISRILLENGLIFAAFSHLGTPYITDKFFSYFRNDEQKHNGFLLFILLFPLIGLSLFLIAFNTFDVNIEDYFIENSPTIVPYIWLSVPMTFCWVYIIVLESYSRVNGRTAIPTFFREVVFRAINILLVLMLGFGWIDFDLFLYLFVGSMALIALSLLLYIKQLGKLYLEWNAAAWNKALVYQMVAFGSIIIIGGIGANLILFIDRNMLANEIDTDAVAIFLVAAYIATVIEIPSKAIRQISSPIMADAVYRDDKTQVKELYQKSALNLLLIGGIMFLLISFNIDALLSILPKSEIYKQGKWVVIIIGAAKWIDMSLGLNIELITYSKYFRLNTFLIVVMAFLAVQANLYLIPIFGIIGAAMATGGIALLSSLLRLAFVRWKFDVMPFSKKDGLALGVLVIAALIGWALPSYDGSFGLAVLSIAIKSILMISAFAFLVIRYNISHDLSVLYNKFVVPIFKR